MSVWLFFHFDGSFWIFIVAGYPQLHVTGNFEGNRSRRQLDYQGNVFMLLYKLDADIFFSSMVDRVMCGRLAAFYTKWCMGLHRFMPLHNSYPKCKPSSTLVSRSNSQTRSNMITTLMSLCKKAFWTH